MFEYNLHCYNLRLLKFLFWDFQLSFCRVLTVFKWDPPLSNIIERFSIPVFSWRSLQNHLAVRSSLMRELQSLTSSFRLEADSVTGWYKKETQLIVLGCWRLWEEALKMSRWDIETPYFVPRSHRIKPASTEPPFQGSTERKCHGFEQSFIK